ncbi:transposase [Streptomyces sp. CB02400]|uniref:transposase n=1 Tax=Streptomyces sp. CB02400 TaxID=1703944 RepID=UPI003FA78658
MIDAQSVKTSANVAETSRGIAAGKKTKGRKRHVITDTLGLVLAVLVTAASVHDTTGGKLLLDDLAAAHPTVSKVWADGGCRSGILNHGADPGIGVEVVQRPRTGRVRVAAHRLRHRDPCRSPRRCRSRRGPPRRHGAYRPRRHAHVPHGAVSGPAPSRGGQVWSKAAAGWSNAVAQGRTATSDTRFRRAMFRNYPHERVG